MMSSQTLTRWIVIFALGIWVVTATGYKPLSGQTQLDEKEEDDDLEERFPGGASLKTDPELERLLKIADAYAADGRYNVAAELWQKALNETGDTLITRDGRVYHSLAEDIEQIIAKLPPAGLRTYRLSADGEALAILAQTDRDRQELLSEVVRKYFISEHGDEAAFELACLALDSHDFIGASRLLNKILTQHPDSSISKDAILMRMSVANAQLGDDRGAQNAIEQAKAQAEHSVSEDALDLVSAHVKSLRSTKTELGGAGENWHMPFGDPRRRGEMKPLPKSVMANEMTELWAYEFPLSLTGQGQENLNYGIIPVVGSVEGGDESFEFAFDSAYPVSYELSDSVIVPSTRSTFDFEGDIEYSARTTPVLKRAYFDSSFGGGFYGRGLIPQANQHIQQSLQGVVARWRSQKWRPTGNLLIVGDKIYYKTNADLTCWHINGSSSKPAWRTAWLNHFRVDGMTQSLMTMGMINQNTPNPGTPAEIMLFGDRIHQSMCILDGVVYSIEGQRFAHGENISTPQQAGGVPYGTIPRRTRQNWLAAYNAETGKAKWYRSAAEEEEEGDEALLTSQVGFLAAPVPFGKFLIAPISKDGVNWLIAMEKETGKTVWRTYLCDEPAAGSRPWAPIHIAVEGRDIYATCGSGVVFSVDAVSGMIRTAVRYQRSAPTSSGNNQQNAMMAFQIRGWNEDLVIPAGRALIVTASDHDGLFAIDRRTGEVLWESPRSPFDNAAEYVLGVHGDNLYVAGSKEVRCYDIHQGKLLWVTEVDSALGRGALTGDAVYIPEDKTIVRLNLETGAKESTTNVSLTSDQPVGNLYSDGEKLWAVGANRLYALTSLEHRMEMLADEIAKGNPEAYLQRMLLRLKLKEADAAVEDLASGVEIIRQKNSPQIAATVLIDRVEKVSVYDSHPSRVLSLLNESLAAISAKPNTEQDEEIFKRATSLYQTIFKIVRDKELKSALAEVLASTQYLSKPYALRNASQTLKLIITKEDEAALLDLLRSKSPSAQLVAAETAGKVDTDAVRGEVRSLLTSQNEPVKLAAARTITNWGEKEALLTFVDLLSANELAIRRQAAEALRSASGEKFDFNATKDQQARAESIAKWKNWVTEKSADVELTLPLPDGPLLLGRTLISYYSQNVIIELDSDNNEIWRKSVPGVWSVQGLSNGHRMASLYSTNAVVEFDAEGNEVWRMNGLPGNPFNVRRLENGNTLVACSDSEQVVEISPDKKIVKKIRVSGRPMDAHRLENGNTLVALANSSRVVEVNDQGEIKKVVATNMPGAISAQRLDTGNTLIVNMNNGTVVEVDPAGKTVWTRSGLSQPYDAQRLENGNTLIAENNAVMEVTNDGKIVWKRTSNGASGVSRF